MGSTEWTKGKHFASTIEGDENRRGTEENMSAFEDLINSHRELDETLEQIAAVAHHGGLIGFADEHACLNEIRRLSLRWWDMAECSKLQRNTNDDNQQN